MPTRCKPLCMPTPCKPKPLHTRGFFATRADFVYQIQMENTCSAPMKSEPPPVTKLEAWGECSASASPPSRSSSSTACSSSQSSRRGCTRGSAAKTSSRSAERAPREDDRPLVRGPSALRRRRRSTSHDSGGARPRAPRAGRVARRARGDRRPPARGRRGHPRNHPARVPLDPRGPPGARPYLDPAALEHALRGQRPPAPGADLRIRAGHLDSLAEAGALDISRHAPTMTSSRTGRRCCRGGDLRRVFHGSARRAHPRRPRRRSSAATSRSRATTPAPPSRSGSHTATPSPRSSQHLGSRCSHRERIREDAHPRGAGARRPDPVHAVNMSAAALFRVVADQSPTLLLDEADTYLGTAIAKQHEDIRGLINAGHRRGAMAYRGEVRKDGRASSSSPRSPRARSPASATCPTRSSTAPCSSP